MGVFDDFVRMVNDDDSKLAAFLAAEGVLKPNPLSEMTQFKMSSPLIDALVRLRVIPKMYPSSPNMVVPIRNGSLDIC